MLEVCDLVHDVADRDPGVVSKLREPGGSSSSQDAHDAEWKEEGGSHPPTCDRGGRGISETEEGNGLGGRGRDPTGVADGE